MSREAPRGHLVAVGIGMQLGRHASERARTEIAAADVVFALVDAFALVWLRDLRADVMPLHEHYAEGKDRRNSYREMQERVLAPVRQGRRVCLVLYGHPGVFADVPHAALAVARAEGHDAHMEPGVSAEACLYADLGIDPGKAGVQSFETTQFLVNQRVIDPTALLILWQPAHCGDLGCSRFATTPERLALLVQKLTRFYDGDPEIVLYEAPRLPIENPRVERLALSALPGARLEEHTTLVVPPMRGPQPDEAMRQALARTPDP